MHDETKIHMVVLPRAGHIIEERTPIIGIIQSQKRTLIALDGRVPIIRSITCQPIL